MGGDVKMCTHFSVLEKELIETKKQLAERNLENGHVRIRVQWHVVDFVCDWQTEIWGRGV